jgi:hypothetical protein
MGPNQLSRIDKQQRIYRDESGGITSGLPVICPELGPTIRVESKAISHNGASGESARFHLAVYQAIMLITSSGSSLDRSAGLLLPSLNVYAHYEEP